MLDAATLDFPHGMLLNTVYIALNIKEGVNGSWQVRDIGNRNPNKVGIYLFGGAAFSRGSGVLPICCAAPDSGRSGNSRVHCESLVANWRMWADFSPPVGKVKTTRWNVRAIRDLLLQFLARIVRGCAVDQCFALQRAEH